MSLHALTPLRRGLLLVSAAAIAWGFGGATADELFRTSGLGPVAVSFWRFATAALLLNAPRLRGRSGAGSGVRADRRTSALIGVSLAISQTAYFGSVRDSGLALATVITIGLNPVLVAIGARACFGERLSRRGAAAVAIALAGLVLLVARPGESSPHTLRGIGLAVLSALTYSAVTLLARSASGAVAGATTWATGALCLLPFAAAQGVLPAGAAVVESAAWLLFLGVVPTLLAYRWYFTGLTTVPSTTAAVLVLLEPATAAVLAALLGEPITWPLVLGSALLLAAIAILGREQG